MTGEGNFGANTPRSSTKDTVTKFIWIDPCWFQRGDEMPKQKFDRMELVALWNRFKGNESKVARHLGVTRAAVRKARESLPDEYFIVDLKEFRRERANLLATIQKLGVQELVRRLGNPKEAKNISIQQLAVLVGTMYDKERLELGKATEHIAHAHYEALDGLDKDMIKELAKKRTLKKIEEVRADAISRRGSELDDADL